MPEMKQGNLKPVQTANRRGYRKKPIIQRVREEPEMPRVPIGRGRGRGEQNEPTKPAAPEGPADHRGVVFKSYTPLDTSKLSNVLIPVDPCGAASENAVVAINGNVYLAVSSGRRCVVQILLIRQRSSQLCRWTSLGDQQIVYVPQIDRFVWCMLHGPVAATGDGAFRVAFASSVDVKAKPKPAWSYVRFRRQ